MKSCPSVYLQIIADNKVKTFALSDREETIKLYVIFCTINHYPTLAGYFSHISSGSNIRVVCGWWEKIYEPAFKKFNNEAIKVKSS